ncbi:hypothetical protein [Salinisphaera orenii]|uniref:hypothetical protein n=1 Tax=Salinisphaera orenii TaxID=856731 RepID=UPI0013A66A6E
MTRIVLIAFSLILSGCATFNSSYTPSVPDKATKFPDVENKIDISFSVSLMSQVGNLVGISKEDIVDKMTKELRETGMYRKVLYRPPDDRLENHLMARIVISGATEREQYALGMIWGSTLMVVPVWANFYSDASLIKLKGDEEVFSATGSEKFTQLFWLPAIVLSPVFNNWTIASNLLDKQTNYVISELVKYRKTGYQ